MTDRSTVQASRDAMADQRARANPLKRYEPLPPAERDAPLTWSRALGCAAMGTIALLGAAVVVRLAARALGIG